MEYQGSTALITGASSGIGAAFADALAARGTDLVLVARSTDQLEAVAATARERHGVRAEVITADLTAPDAAGALRAEVDRRGLSVDILVNNAGFGSAGPFQSVTADRSRREVALDVAAVVDLSHAFLPDMTERRRGGVINLSSTAAFQPAPNFAVYAAAKSFVLSFSQALWAECRPHGVEVLAVCPGPVETNFFDVLGTEQVKVGQILGPEQVVRTALRAFDRGRAVVIPGARNAVLPVLQRFVPRRLVLSTATRMLKGVTAETVDANA
ncbi:MAG: SDR family oxidoreductase [Actinocatenispora sp.]